MANPRLNKTYICLHTYTHPNLGRLLTKGNKYTCTAINTENDIISMKGTRRGGINCCLKFFEENLGQPTATWASHTQTTTHTVAVGKIFFYTQRVVYRPRRVLRVLLTVEATSGLIV